MASTPIFSTSSSTKDDVPAPLGHALRLPLLDDGDELVDEHLYSVRVEAEQPGRSLEPLDVAVVIGAEHVDGAVEAAGELVEHICDVGREVEVAAVRRADERPVLVVAVRSRARPERALRLVGVEPIERGGDLRLDLGLAHPGFYMDSQLLQLGADLGRHQLDRVAFARRDLLDVGAAVAVLGRLLSTPPRLHRLAEEVDLAADVVVVVLALDLVPGELEQPRDSVAVGAVAADPTVSGPVGLAETSSTWMRCLVSADPAP